VLVEKLQDGGRHCDGVDMDDLKRWRDVEWDGDERGEYFTADGTWISPFYLF
jgi:hypothetical protein